MRKCGTRPGRYELPSDEHRHRRARDLYEAVSRMLPDPGRPRELPDGDPVSLAGLAGDWRVAPAVLTNDQMCETRGRPGAAASAQAGFRRTPLTTSVS